MTVREEHYCVDSKFWQDREASHMKLRGWSLILLMLIMRKIEFYEANCSKLLVLPDRRKPKQVSINY